MNRKQRRIAQSQSKDAAIIRFHGKSYTVEELIGLAVTEHNGGNIQAAVECYNLILAQAPANAEIYNNRGKALQSLGRIDEALQDYDKAIAFNNRYADPHNNRGMILYNLQRYEEALICYEKAVTINYNFAYAYNNRGIVLHKLQRYAEALVNYDRAIANNPHFAYAHNNRGITLLDMQRYDDALASYDKAIAITPGQAEFYTNRGFALHKLYRVDEALASFIQADALKQDIPYLTGHLLYTSMQLCRWHDFSALVEKAAGGIETGRPTLEPLEAVVAPFSAAQQRKCGEIYIKDKYPLSVPKLWNGERYTHEKIRIAYVSTDFREHVMPFLMAGVFEHHDKTRFETYGISLQAEAQDAMGQRVKAAFNHFIDVSQKSDQQVAQLLRDWEIDIAVDLMGFTGNCRTGIFARRPAPAHINYLGYPATMGADYIDYIIADAFVVPPHYQQHYAEKIVYLPDCYQANDDKRFVSTEKPRRAQHGLPEQGFVFCSFNNTAKITPDIFGIWMRLLQSVPGSVLWLLSDHDSVKRNLSAETNSRGVDPSRLVFATRVPYDEHLARLANADVFLDTSPFNAGATASDALWAGVPLITCPGEAFASRMAGSLLTTLGLPELIANSASEYEKLALALATDPARLAAIKTKLAHNRAKTPLFDTARFTKNLEAAYVRISERSQKGLPPDHIL